MAAGSLRPNIVRVMTEHREGWLVLIPGPCGTGICVNGGGMLGHWGGVKLYHLVCSCSAKKSELTGQHKCPHHLLREMACLRVGQQRTGRKVLMLPILREACLEFGRELPLCCA